MASVKGKGDGRQNPAITSSVQAKGDALPVDDADAQTDRSQLDLSAWLIWAGIMLLAFAILPFAVRSQELFRAIAVMCGFDLG